MKGYIYTMFQGADPGIGWKMTDPIFDKTPTLGSCVPNIRRVVEKGDYVFSISGRVKNLSQYVVGGFKVQEKVDMLAAYERFPENRMTVRKDGSLKGNIIIDEKGNHLEIDYHTNHERRIENYIVGSNPIVLKTEKEIEQGRSETLHFLKSLFDKDGAKIGDVIGRWRKLNEAQIEALLNWMNKIKGKSR